MNPETLRRWAAIKGISVLGTGDFTHPVWSRELEEKLEPFGEGLFKLKMDHGSDHLPASINKDVFFLLTAEISCIYRKHGKTRRLHSLLLAPGFDEVMKINKALAKIGNLRSDGRPILGLDGKELLKIALDASDKVMFIPAHAWTPHFSVFGAGSGFDSLEECFEELTPHIHAIETGLSSDPPMNWRVSALDGVTLVSNSDAHSPAKIGREANILGCQMSYQGITEAIRSKRGFLGTVEFFPQEGKYYHDGHRTCGVNLTPGEAKEYNLICPVCKKKLTTGVLHRVEQLADRQEGVRPDGAPSFYSLIPLVEIIAGVFALGPGTKTVNRIYDNLVAQLGSELSILMHAAPEDIGAVASPSIGEAVRRMRSGEIRIEPGFDGEYGKIRIMDRVKQPC